MTSPQPSSKSAGTLDEYDRLFDAHSEYEMVQSHSLQKLPVGGDSQEAPDRYRRDIDSSQSPLFFDDHRTALYPHAHKPLRSSEKKKKKAKEVKYKKKYNARPSQLFQPSLQLVKEQCSVGSASESSSTSDLQSSIHKMFEQSENTEDELSLSARSASKSRSPSPSALALSVPVLNVEPATPDADLCFQVLPTTEIAENNNALSAAEVNLSTSQCSARAEEDSTDQPHIAVRKVPLATFLLGGADNDSVDSGDGVHTNRVDNNNECWSMLGNGLRISQTSQSYLPHSQVKDVKFTIGGDSCSNLDGLSLTSSHSNYEKFHMPHKQQNVISNSSEPDLTYITECDDSCEYSLIRCRGSDIELSDLPLRKVATITTKEEAALLNKYDLEDLASHRLEKLRGVRRHKINRKTGAKMNADIIKPVYDQTPHELFIELDELVTNRDVAEELWEWKEKARWIKFEENVLDSADRWGRPHVASLSFHSLIELRKLLENGLVTLDLDVMDYMHLMQSIVESLITSGQLPAPLKEYLLTALCLRHSHLGGRANNMLRSKSYLNLKGLESMSRQARYTHFIGAGNSNHHSPEKMANSDTHTVDMPAEDGEPTHSLLFRRNVSHESNLNNERYNMDLLKRIPEGAEVASVLVGTLKQLPKPCVIFVRLSKGILLEHVAEVPLPVRFMFVFVGPQEETVDYLEIGRSLSTLLSNKNFREASYLARDRHQILIAMNAFLDESIVLPPGDLDKKTLLPIMEMSKSKKLRPEAAKTAGFDKSAEHPEEDPLKRTGRLFGSLVNDVRRKYSKYLSDFRDGLNAQVLAAFVFIYFACLSTAITFGGLLGDKIDNYMGASEMLMATAVAGIIFSLFGGQPLLITAFTGPNMVFEEGVYKFAKDFEIDFLSWRLWIGVWVFIFSLVLVATESVFLIKYVTRFTEEIFAFLISLIFIYEVFYKLYSIFKDHPLCSSYTGCLSDLLNSTNSSVLSNNSRNLTESDSMQPNTALLTLSLIMFTFVIAYALKSIRNKKVLGRTVRRALGDFGVPIAILLMCVIDHAIGDRVFSPKLEVPSNFSVTSPEKRGWLINPLGHKDSLAVAHMFSAALPAIVASILIFMESLIAGIIVDKKENKLLKGSGYNLDVLVLGFITLVNGIFGLPFLCGATIKTVIHVSALTVLSRNHAPGEPPKIEGVIEQRVSNLLVHLLIGASLFLGMILQFIPTAVLFGIFLYMGVASLGGIQLFDRIILLITPKKHHPLEIGYVRFVRSWRMNLFTMIQIAFVIILWAVKLSPAALVFPFALILIIPFRLFVLNHVFSQEELEQLDSESAGQVLTSSDQLDEEPDFYETAHMPF